MNQVMGAVRLMLANHEPFPAIAIDRAWNIRLANRPPGTPPRRAPRPADSLSATPAKPYVL